MKSDKTVFTGYARPPGTQVSKKLEDFFNDPNHPDFPSDLNTETKKLKEAKDKLKVFLEKNSNSIKDPKKTNILKAIAGGNNEKIAELLVNLTVKADSSDVLKNAKNAGLRYRIAIQPDKVQEKSNELSPAINQLKVSLNKDGEQIPIPQDLIEKLKNKMESLSPEQFAKYILNLKIDPSIQSKMPSLKNMVDAAHSYNMEAITLDKCKRSWVNNNFDDYCKAIVSSIIVPDTNDPDTNDPDTNDPDTKDPFSIPGSASPPEKGDLNNNGLEITKNDKFILDTSSTKTIERNGEKLILFKVTSAIIDEKPYAFTNAYFDSTSSRIYDQPENGRYHDHVLVSEKYSPPIITLCDGSGHGPGAAETAIVTAEKAHKTLSDKIKGCKSIHAVLMCQLEALMEANKEAGNKTDVSGSSTTYIQTAVVGDQLTGVVLGDSKVFVFRPKKEGGWEAIDPLGNLKGTLDATESGGQIVANNSTPQSDLHKVHAFTYKLQSGDVVYVCSDGVVDNFDPSTSLPKDSPIKPDEWKLEDPAHIQISLSEAKKQMEALVENCRTGEEIRNIIAKHIEEKTKAKKLMLMTTTSEQRVNLKESDFPGKLDDAAAAVYVYKKVSFDKNVEVSGPADFTTALNEEVRKGTMKGISLRSKSPEKSIRAQEAKISGKPITSDPNAVIRPLSLSEINESSSMDQLIKAIRPVIFSQAGPQFDKAVKQFVMSILEDILRESPSYDLKDIENELIKRIGDTNKKDELLNREDFKAIYEGGNVPFNFQKADGFSELKSTWEISEAYEWVQPSEDLKNAEKLINSHEKGFIKLLNKGFIKLLKQALNESDESKLKKIEENLANEKNEDIRKAKKIIIDAYTKESNIESNISKAKSIIPSDDNFLTLLEQSLEAVPNHRIAKIELANNINESMKKDEKLFNAKLMIKDAYIEKSNIIEKNERAKEILKNSTIKEAPWKVDDKDRTIATRYFNDKELTTCKEKIQNAFKNPELKKAIDAYGKGHRKTIQS